MTMWAMAAERITITRGSLTSRVTQHAFDRAWSKRGWTKADDDTPPADDSTGNQDDDVAPLTEET